MVSTGKDSRPVIGIVGGMGPQAGIALVVSIVQQTTANRDQEHWPVMLMSLPDHIPDRTAFLEGRIPYNPAFPIADIIFRLEAAGASVIGMACNTSHTPRIFEVIVAELRMRSSNIQLLNMPEETCRYMNEQLPHARRIGLMATNGTYYSGLYGEMLACLGYEPILPDPSFQHEVIHPMIYDEAFGLKANAGRITPMVSVLAAQALQYFDRRKADAIILGCTDLSILLSAPEMHGASLIDSTASLARALIRQAKENMSLVNGRNSYRLSF